MDRERFVRFFLIGVIVVCLFLLIFENITIHGRATGGDVVSNVSVNLHLAIDFSPELKNGIVFEDVLILPVENLNAVENYNGTGNSSNYYILVSPDGNVPVDICTNVNSPLMSAGADVIGVANESYSYYGSSNETVPSLVNETSFSLDYNSAGESVLLGSRQYFRFWLDVPAAQPSGEYNNSVNFRALPAGMTC